MAVTKCPIPAHTVTEFTVPPRATRQCGRTGRLDSPFAGLMEKIMSKNTMQNSKASLEVRARKEELSEEQLQKIYGGKASFHDLNFVHKLDKASPVLMQA
jgi:bacteriocin-like protein